MMASSIYNLADILKQAVIETIVMVGIAAPICAGAGLALGLLLTISHPLGIAPNRGLQQVLSSVTNISRSIPFLVLIVLLVPLTRLLVGTSIGTAAAIVPLVLGGIPYAARMAEAALLDVDPELVRAIAAMGATTPQLMLKVYLPEALPGLVRTLTVLVITMINFSAMAGAVGGGGLGDLAIRYGYQRFRFDVLLSTVIILIVLVQGVQLTGNIVARRLDRRRLL